MGDLRHFIDKKAFKNGRANEYIENNKAKLEWSIEIFLALSFFAFNSLGGAASTNGQHTVQMITEDLSANHNSNSGSLLQV